MTYPKDERGIYSVPGTWIDAWDGPQSGWCRCEVRAYADGTTLVHRGEPVYLGSAPAGLRSLHSVYLTAAAALQRAQGGKT